MAKRKPLGVRNRNPLNIRYNKCDIWLGMAGQDSGFCKFKSFVWGYRAAFRLLKVYNDRYHIFTIRGIINRWAPPSENFTNEYIMRVCKEIGYDEMYIIDIDTPRDREDAILLVRAMASVETGVPFKDIDPQPIEYAWDYAFEGKVIECAHELDFYKEGNKERREQSC